MTIAEKQLFDPLRAPHDVESHVLGYVPQGIAAQGHHPVFHIDRNIIERIVEISNAVIG